MILSTREEHMRNPSQIVGWLSDIELQEWVREACDVDSYKKRLAIWLTVIGPFHAHQVAAMLGVSTPSVWLWLSQYNKRGPSGLSRKGRGGRRRAFLSWDEEEAVLNSLETRAVEGKVLTAKQLLPVIRQEVGKEVCLGYVYALLKRHRWRKLGPRPRHVKADPEKQEEFKKNSRSLFSKP